MNDIIRQVLIDGYPIDIAKMERHSFSSEVTTHPVENGAEITDHVRNNPDEISLECVVSDTPIGSIAQHDTRLVDVSEDEGGIPRPSIDAYARLKALHRARKPVTIETSLDRFENMILVRLGIPRDSTTTGGLTFEAEFTQITIVTNRRVIVPVAVPRGKGSQNLGLRSGAAYTTDSRVVWRIGQPPGAPLDEHYAWAVVNFTKPVGQLHNHPGATKTSRVGVRFSGEHSGQVAGFPGSRVNTHRAPPFHEHITADAELGAALLFWFNKDLDRDLAEKEQAFARNNDRTLIRSGGGPTDVKNLPPGQDLSRFTRPPSSTFPTVGPRTTFAPGQVK